MKKQRKGMFGWLVLQARQKEAGLFVFSIASAFTMGKAVRATRKRRAAQTGGANTLKKAQRAGNYKQRQSKAVEALSNAAEGSAV
jgi:hypothetical protein